MKKPCHPGRAFPKKIVHESLIEIYRGYRNKYMPGQADIFLTDG